MLDTATTLTSLLNDPSLLETRSYIGGQWVDGDKGTYDVINPARGDVVAEVADLSRAQVAGAIAQAEVAQKEWAKWSGKERSAVLRKWFDLMMAHQDDLGAILTAEQGKPLAEAKGEIAYGASFVEFFGEEAKRIYGETIPGHQRDKRITVIKQPIGVAASITPWNFPNAMITRKAAPALAAGCAFIARPAELTPLSAIAMGVLAERAGIPAGVFQVVTTSDASETGKEFCENPIVRKLTFTGSTQVGRILLRQAADQVMKCSMELGGNAPFIVFDDADLDAAVEGAMMSKFRNAGQTCVCANRIYVQAGVYDAFAAKLKAAVDGAEYGRRAGTDGVTTGPLISAGLRSPRCKTTSRTLPLAGRRVVLTGGQVPDLGGFFMQPTVVTGVTQDMKVAQEETFGPLAPLFKFDERGRRDRHGQRHHFRAGGVLLRQGPQPRVQSGRRAGIRHRRREHRASSRPRSRPSAAIKQSGLGREGSHHGIENSLR